MSDNTDTLQLKVQQSLSAIDNNTVVLADVASTLTPSAVMADLNITDPSDISASDATDDECTYVSNIIDNLLNRDFSDPAVQVNTRDSMAQFQNNALSEASFTSEKLQGPMMKIAGTVEGNKLLDSLTDLDIKMRGMHPSQHNLEGNWLQKLIATILPMFKPVRKYFMMLQSQQSVLGSMKDMVESGIVEREKDGRILEMDKLSLTKCALKLDQAIRIGKLLDERMEYSIERDISDPKEKQFMQSEVLFTLRQTVRALHEQLAVTNQGIMAMELLLRLNRETINSGRRTLNVSMHALSIAGVLATVMAGMREFNAKISAMKETANDFIAYNGEMLEQTTVEVGEISRSSTLDISVLETAFDKIHTAYDNEIGLRVSALSTMKEEMTRLDSMNTKSAELITEMERGRNATGAMNDQLALSDLPDSVKVA